MSHAEFLKFKKILKFVWENKYSNFYRTKYKKAGFNPLTDFKSEKDIAKIPFLTKEELQDVGPDKLLFIDNKDVDMIVPTSGTTTGKSFYTFRSKCNIPSSPRMAHHGKMMIFFPPARSHVLFNAHRDYEDKRKNWILVGDIHNLPASCQIAEELGINTIHTTPTIAILLKDYIESRPALKKSLKMFEISAEFISDERRNFLRKLYPGVKIYLTHGMIEVRQTADQCSYLINRKDKIFYHKSIDWDNYLENINQKSGENAAEGEKGELTATSFWNLAMPMIRYKTGDLVSFEKNNCPCKAPGPLLQFWGRNNFDIIKVGGIEFKTYMLDKPLLNLRKHLKEDFRANFYESYSGNKQRIKILLELALKKGTMKSQILEDIIKNEFMKNWQLSAKFNLKKAIELGIVQSFKINFIEFPKTDKPIKRLILH